MLQQMYFVSFQRWKGSLGCMKKLLLTLLALGIAGNAYAANLLMDIKSKDYNASTALTEINGAITTLAEKSTENYTLRAKPIITNALLDGTQWRSGLPYTTVKGMVENGANGYIFYSRGKINTFACTLTGISLSITNNKDTPLVIDVNQSSIKVGDFEGQPFYTGKFMDAGTSSQPPIVVGPKATKSVLLRRSDFQFERTSITACWAVPLYPINFDNISIELDLKIDDAYEVLTAAGKLDMTNLQKYDLDYQWNQNKKKYD